MVKGPDARLWRYLWAVPVALSEVPADLRSCSFGGAYALIDFALRAAETRGVPGTVYVHPWELDPAQPRIRTSLLTRARHYGGLGRTAPRMKRLLSSFAFDPSRRLCALQNCRRHATHFRSYGRAGRAKPLPGSVVFSCTETGYRWRSA